MRPRHALAASALSLLVVTACSTPSAPSSTTAPSTVPSAAGSPRASETTPAEGASASTPADGSVTVTLSGDLLWHDTLWKSAKRDAARTGKGPYDYDPLFEYLTPILRGADLSVCHEEVPFAKDGGPYKNYPVFSVPPHAAPAMARAGFDVCSTASNHSVDAGFDGLVQTLDVLDANKIKHFGTARTQAESQQPVILDVKGIKIGFVGGTFGTNGMPVKNDWSVDMWDTDTLIAKAKAAKEAGADFVMVALHGGVEYRSAPTDEQVEHAKELTASPYVDVVYGHHAHVVQGWTTMNGKYVIYGLGNLVNHGMASEPRVYEGVIARLTITREGEKVRVSKAEYIPTLGTRGPGGNPPIRVYPVKEALAKGLYDANRLRTAQERTRDTVLSLGASDLVEA